MSGRRRIVVQRLVVHVPEPGAQRERDTEKSKRLGSLSASYSEKRGKKFIEVERPHSQCSRRNRHDAAGRRPFPQGTRRHSKLARALRAQADGRR